MELREVRTFLVLAEELHFGRAAVRLGVTQGRVSQTIQALERELGAALFERTSRRVLLTPFGERFSVGARRGYDELIKTLRSCQTVARGVIGQVRIGYAPTIGGAFATRLAMAFEARHPQCSTMLNVIAMRHTQAPETLFSTGEVDVALVWSPGGDGQVLEHPDLTVGPVLAEVGRGVVVPAGHPLTEHRTVSMEDLAGYELLRPPAMAGGRLSELWTPRLTPSGRPLKHTADDVITLTGRTELIAEDMLTLVARGHGLHCTVVSLLERFPFPGLEIIPLRDMPPMVIVPVWLTAAGNAAIRAFADSAAGLGRSPRGAAEADTGGAEDSPAHAELMELLQ